MYPMPFDPPQDVPPPPQDLEQSKQHRHDLREMLTAVLLEDEEDARRLEYIKRRLRVMLREGAAGD